MNNQLSVQNMQRHFSDTAYLPQVSSRLNPNPNLITRPSRGLPVGTVQQRGTMSMPTSPIMKKMVIQPTANPGIDLGQGIWESLQTAQAFFSSHYHQQQQQLQQQNNPHPLPTHNQASSQDQIQLPNQNQDQNPNSGFTNHVSPMDLTLSSSMYYDLSSQPPTTSSLQYISPPSTRFQTQPPNTGSGMGLGIGMDIDSPFMDHAGFPNRTVSPTTNNQVKQDGVEDNDMNPDTGAGTGTGFRKKRIQVRIACTHCQKACKKCSNTRPCERCVKYGLTECVDSTRKPRKTGIKRGPYKRRSSRYSATGYPYPLTGDGGDGGSLKTKMNDHQYQFPNQNSNTNINTVPNHSHVQAGFHLSKPNHTRANFSHPPHNHTNNHSNSTSMSENSQSPHSNSNPLHHQPSSTHSQSIVYPPFPKPTPTASSNLVTAISNALSLPQQSQWVDGQRLPLNSKTNGVTPEEENGSKKGKTSPMYPKTPVGVFPFSLVGGKDDPFSRAVSPIKQFEFDFASAGESPHGNVDVNRSGLSEVIEESEGVEVEENASAFISTSVSSTLPLPNNTSTRQTNETITNTTNLRVNTQPMISSPLSMGPGTGAYTPYVLPSKIRKPSLRTLMSTSTSRAPSPTATTHTQGMSNPLSNIDMELQSPTLFTACADDSGMLLDVDEIEGWDTPWSVRNEDAGGEGDDGIRNHGGNEAGLFEGIMGLH
ncbi:uncharacterized protein L199_007827 [Kwoniella botswanensis]|uniref:uncharacterized protein n=1 Tax=Kwoniella botswanensis TaxID=1268659 RepID=UPI00315D3759